MMPRHYRALARAGADEVSEGRTDQVAHRPDAQARWASLAAALGGITEGDRDVLWRARWA